VVRYPILLDPNPELGAFTSTVPALPGCVTEGAAFDEPVANAREAITGFVEMLHKLGDSVPLEVPGLAVVGVEVPAPAAEAVA